jgi:hypothetical protein
MEMHNDRGSTFIMCLRWSSEPEYTKYPRLPVLRCAGFEEKPGRIRIDPTTGGIS